MKKILMILTSNSRMENTDATTGVWLGTFTGPYYEFIDKGYEVTLASLAGGEPPVDPFSRLTENIPFSDNRFNKDSAAQQAFKNTVIIESAKADDFDGLFFTGGHGVLGDFAVKDVFGRLVLDFYNAGKPVVCLCHGPAALANAAGLQPGLLKGKKVTSFTTTEEKLAMRINNIPFRLEDRLRELGADFRSSSIPMQPHVEVDGLLITGQNPLSAVDVARAFIDVLENKSQKNIPKKP